MLTPFHLCDGIPHCADMRDEADCMLRFRCETGDDGKISVPVEMKCDGKRDCKDGADEHPDLCPERFFCSALNGTKVKGFST